MSLFDVINCGIGTQFKDVFAEELRINYGALSQQQPPRVIDRQNSGQSADNFVTGRAGIRFETSLPGIDETTAVLFTINRADFDAGSIIVELEFNGTRLVAELDATLDAVV